MIEQSLTAAPGAIVSRKAFYQAFGRIDAACRVEQVVGDNQSGYTCPNKA